MVCARSSDKKKDHGSRNYFCAEIGGDAHTTLVAMRELGLVRPGRKINGDRDQYFHATMIGCNAIGLSSDAAMKALGN